MIKNRKHKQTYEIGSIVKMPYGRFGVIDGKICGRGDARLFMVRFKEGGFNTIHVRELDLIRQSPEKYGHKKLRKCK